MLKKIFIDLALQYSSDQLLIHRLWDEIDVAYRHPKRHYHTLIHLENLYKEISNCKDKIEDWNIVQFAIFYHDIIYNVLKQNNEEKSARAAELNMNLFTVTDLDIKKCKTLILATKNHIEHIDPDINYFTDADLSILGKNWGIYEIYIQQIRMEYAIYPDLLYNPARKKVLDHFLGMTRIFKTDFFFTKYDAQARENITRELTLI